MAIMKKVITRAKIEFVAMKQNQIATYTNSVFIGHFNSLDRIQTVDAFSAVDFP
jgi:hypothetical protein